MPLQRAPSLGGSGKLREFIYTLHSTTDNRRPFSLPTMFLQSPYPPPLILTFKTRFLNKSTTTILNCNLKQGQRHSSVVRDESNDGLRESTSLDSLRGPRLCCCCCGRRRLIGGAIGTTLLPVPHSEASSLSPPDPTLPSLGITPQLIILTHATKESDKDICIRETSPQNSIIIIDMSMTNQRLRRPMTADSALMNPNSRILALKAQIAGTTQDHLQIFNIELKVKMKSHPMPEQVDFGNGSLQRCWSETNYGRTSSSLVTTCNKQIPKQSTARNPSPSYTSSTHQLTMTGTPEQAQNNHPPSDEDAKKRGTHIMGPPAVATVRPDNQKAASWSAAADHRQFFQSHHPYLLQHTPADKPSNNPFEQVGNMFNSWCTIAKVIARNIWHNLASSSLPPRWSNEGQGLITAESRHPLITAESHSMSRQLVKGSSDRADGCGKAMVNSIRPPRPDWYEELYAWALGTFTKSYEAQVEDYKSLIFANLRGKAETVLEIGIGAGPNLKYYANTGVHVFGVDPNKKFEKYAQAEALNVGLPPADFKFIHAVAEALPLPDASVDAVIGTLVLCSVKDVNMALKEVIRVLKPGGLYLFVEHVAGQDGSTIKFFQRILDPLQQIISDGCHLTMTTGKYISEAGFSEVDLKMVYVPKAYIVSPHVYGVARK